MTHPPTYHSFLLRIWRSSRGEPSRWLASLENTRTGDRRGFATLAEAFAFLEAELGGAQADVQVGEPGEPAA